MKKKILANIGMLLTLTSALLAAFNIIIEKKYINNISSEKILFLMYLGAGSGLYFIHLLTRKKYKEKENMITKKEVPKIVTIVVCELLSSFLIIEAVKNIDASLVSLLLIFEIVMTTLCAYLIFKQQIGKNEIIAIVFILLGSFILNFKTSIFSNIGFNSLLVILACLCWGIENNLTALISSKEPAFFTAIKCGAVSLLYLILVIIKGDFILNYPILILYGFFTYGISILFYAISTRYLGASKATMIFSFNPIFGALLAFIIYDEKLSFTFLISTVLMILGILFMNYKKIKH